MKGKRARGEYGRWRTAAGNSLSASDMLHEHLAKCRIMATNAEIEAFGQWLTNDLWQKYKAQYMEQQNIAIKRMDNTPIVISNATMGKAYTSQIIELPEDASADYEFEGLDDTGLEIVREAGGNKFVIKGTPKITGDVTLKIKYKFNGWIPGLPVLEREICFVINPDPRSLWRNIPTSKDIPYYKKDADSEYIKVKAGADGSARKDIVAASNRGRSHAQDGKARDDDFRVHYSPDNEWYILAVADGAGSAKYSRKGSEVACEFVLDYCRNKLENNAEFERAIREYHNVKDDKSKEGAARKRVGDFVYQIVGHAAFFAHKAIAKVSAHNEGSRPKDFATTLLLAICKKFDFGWFIGSFWVGDGAMCIYNKDTQYFRLLGVPDEGEFSGQTRFLTMSEIMTDNTEMYNRLRFSIVDDFTALMLMTDGVSDPMFGTDANLNNINKWNDLWSQLQSGFPEDDIPGVDFTDDNEASKDQLLNWLNFWKTGEHDDRTIVILH